MTNYPDIEDRLQRLEQQVAAIQKKLDEIVQWIRDLEERVEPAVTTQRIKDEWDGMGGGRW